MRWLLGNMLCSSFLGTRATCLGISLSLSGGSDLLSPDCSPAASDWPHFRYIQGLLEFSWRLFCFWFKRAPVSAVRPSRSKVKRGDGNRMCPEKCKIWLGEAEGKSAFLVAKKLGPWRDLQLCSIVPCGVWQRAGWISAVAPTDLRLQVYLPATARSCSQQAMLYPFLTA